jgi:hypothetical protein
VERRWLIFGLLALSAGLSFYFASRGPQGPTPRAQCVADRDCQKGERCVVVPKGDGFVTIGQCGEACEADEACPNGWGCGSWIEERGRLVPERGAGPQIPRVKACAHRSRLP